ncbi:MAG: hypothetical protein JRJ65_14695, partial [Deltaproteobacteria bacterium]|nr:hypothetical protein [Deltaproteobacteria bacterium]
ENVPGILIKNILRALDHEAKKHGAITCEDADKNGHEQAGHMLLQPVMSQPNENMAHMFFTILKAKIRVRKSVFGKGVWIGTNSC